MATGGYVFKSKAMQAQQAKQAEREQKASTVLAQIGAQFVRVKQRVEELWGERGTNRAVRQRDFAAVKEMGTLRDEDGNYNAVRTAKQLDEIKTILIKIADSKGASE